MKRTELARGTSELKRSYMPPRTSRIGSSAPSRSARAQRAVAATRAPRRTAGRRDTIPPKVRCQVADRDPWCVHCGSPRNLHQHHRRLKGDGGDTRPHTDCSCNLVRLCDACHYWAHVEDRRAAEAEGLIIPAETMFPGSESVMIHEASGSGVTQYPTCDGQWSSAPGQVAA